MATETLGDRCLVLASTGSPMAPGRGRQQELSEKAALVWCLEPRLFVSTLWFLSFEPKGPILKGAVTFFFPRRLLNKIDYLE